METIRDIKQREFGFLFIKGQRFNEKKGETENIVRMVRRMEFNDENELFEYIEEKKPADCFFSAAYWTFPKHACKERGFWNGCDLFFDLDSENLKLAHTEAKIIFDELQDTFGIDDLEMIFCVTGDTPVLIRDSNGVRLVTVKNLVDTIRDGEKVDVLSLDRNGKLCFSPVVSFHESEGPVFEILYEQTTLPVKATASHRIFVWDRGDIIPKRVDRLTTDDYVVTYNIKNTNHIGELYKHFIPAQGKKKYVRFSYTFREEVREEVIPLSPPLMRLIGYYLAEGYVSQGNRVGFSFNSNEKKYINDCARLIRGLLKYNPSFSHPHPSTTTIHISSRKWCSFFETFCGEKKNKHIPSFCWGLPKRYINNLLLGYLRGDGSKTDEYSITVKSVSQRLATEIVWLLKLRGISCTIREEITKGGRRSPEGKIWPESHIYMVKIPRSQLIGVGEREFYRENKKCAPQPSDCALPLDALREVYYAVKPKNFNRHRKERSAFQKDRANYDTTKSIIDWIEKENEIPLSLSDQKIVDKYKQHLHDDIGILKVKRVERLNTIEKVYDITVKDSEAFFGGHNPILLHNSGSKGYHVVAYGYRDNPELTRKLRNLDGHARAEIIDYFTDGWEIQSIDREATVDVHRLRRIPGTINSKSGKMCEIVKRS